MSQSFLSQSHQMDMACEVLYATKHIENIGTPSSEPALRGTHIHDACKLYVRHLVQKRLKQDYGFFDNMVELGGYLPEAVKILRKLRGSITIDPEAVLLVEGRLYLDGDFKPIEKPTPFEYAGTLDLLEAHGSEGMIRDWKSHYYISKADTFQGLFYSVLAFCCYPHLEKITFELMFVRYGVAKQVEYLREDLPEMTQTVRATRQRQLAVHRKHEQRGLAGLTALPGSHCCYCSLLMNGCPIDAINPYANPSPEERVRLGIKLLEMKKQNDRVLRDIVKAQGPIKIEDANGNPYAAAYHPTETMSFPANTIYPELEAWQEGHPNDRITEKVRIGSTELKPLLETKKRAGLATQIEPLIQITEKTIFRISGIEDEDFGDDS